MGGRHRASYRQRVLTRNRGRRKHYLDTGGFLGEIHIRAEYKLRRYAAYFLIDLHLHRLFRDPLILCRFANLRFGAR